MKLIHPLISTPIVFEENKINILVIEDQKVFAGIIIELMNQINGFDGNFVLSSNLKELELEKTTDILIDLFSLDLNQKKIINKVYNQLKATSIEEYIDLTYLLGEILKYIEKITLTTQHPLIYSQDIDVAGIFKLADLRIETSYVSIIEKLINYLSIMQEFNNTSLFILINLKSYFSTEEMQCLYQHILYNKLNVLLLENTVREGRSPQENYRIIDMDLCELF